MYQDINQRPLYRLQDSSVDELIAFIESKCKERSRCKFTIDFNRKGYQSGFFNISCYSDYYKGYIVSINTQNGSHGKCCINDPEYREYVYKMVKISENEYHY